MKRHVPWIRETENMLRHITAFAKGAEATEVDTVRLTIKEDAPHAMCVRLLYAWTVAVNAWAATLYVAVDRGHIC